MHQSETSEKQTNEVNSERFQSSLPFKSGLRVLYSRIWGVVALSLIFGFLGGTAGSWYFFQSPKFGLNTNRQESLSQLRQTVRVEEESSVIDVVKKAGPAVVSIVVTKDLSQLPNYYFDPFGTNLFPSNPSRPDSNNSQPNLQQVGAGSGFLVSADGLILTNKHVVADEQASYTVVLSDGSKYSAKVLARDPRDDLALVKIDIQNAPFLKLADSSNLQIGQKVVAIGNSLGQYQNTVTSGIVSGIGRSITAGAGDSSEQLEGVIQTDAAINPGNSGGPLLNLSGEVVGVNTAIDREGQLVGFAIPANDALRALESFQKYKKIVRPFLGVRYLMINPEIAASEKLPKEYGALIVRGDKLTDFAVIPGSPADKAGLMENDIILEVDGKKLDKSTSLSAALKNKNVGDNVTLKVYHKGEEKLINITLEEAK